MNQFNEIAPVDIRQNPFQTVGRDWMLITAGPPDNFNMMTASWGTWGHLWERDVAILLARLRHLAGREFDFLDHIHILWGTIFFDSAF